MKKLLLCIFLAILPLVGCGNSLVEEAKSSVVSMTDAAGTPRCTGVAIGEHLVWTKSHCLANSTFKYNGVSCPTDKAIHDGHDNALVKTCQSYPNVATVATTPPQPGDDVILWGHLYGLPLLMMQGKHMGTFPLPIEMGTVAIGTPAYGFDLLVGPGTSGGPMFNSAGEVMCTQMGSLGRYGEVAQIALCVPHKFTPEQMQGNF